MKKRIIIFLTFFIIITGISINVNASNDSKSTFVEKNYYIHETNPLYPEYKTSFLKGKVELKYNNPNEITPMNNMDYYVENTNTILEQIRDYAVSRNSSFYVYFKIENTEKKTDEFFNKYIRDLINNAMDEDLSISSSDGDYLKWSWYDYDINNKCWEVENSNNYSYYINLHIALKYTSTYEQEQILDEEIDEFNNLYINQDDNRFEKLCKIYDYITSNITYDEENLNNPNYVLKHSAYAAMNNKTAVCQGYATLLYKMLKEVGINEVRIIVSEDHAWNAIKIGDLYYGMDSTWDSSNNAKSYSDWYFFLKGTNFFNTLSSHTMKDYFYSEKFVTNYPLSAYNYNFTTESYKTKKFGININLCNINDVEDTYKFAGQEIKPEILLQYQDYGLVEGRDYIVEYKNNELPGIAEIQISGLGFFEGQIIKNFQITHSITDDEFHIWDNEQINEPATLTTNGSKTCYCSTCGANTEKIIPKIDKITLSKNIFIYNGKVQKPSITVKDSEGYKIDSSNYSVSYSNSSSKKVGEYKITINFKGEKYSGSKTLKYKIIPKGTSLSKLTALKKSFKATWKAQKTETTGYEILYSTDKNFKKANKSVIISKNKTLSSTIKKLNAKKKYYVRIRTYKKVGSTKYYSDWSKSKYITTKK